MTIRIIIVALNEIKQDRIMALREFKCHHRTSQKSLRMELVQLNTIWHSYVLCFSIEICAFNVYWTYVCMLGIHLETEKNCIVACGPNYVI